MSPTVNMLVISGIKRSKLFYPPIPPILYVVSEPFILPMIRAAATDLSPTIIITPYTCILLHSTFTIFTLFNLHDLLWPIHSTCYYSFFKGRFWRLCHPKVIIWPKGTGLVRGRAEEEADPQGVRSAQGPSSSQHVSSSRGSCSPESWEWCSLESIWQTNLHMLIFTADQFQHVPLSETAF